MATSIFEFDAIEGLTLVVELRLPGSDDLAYTVEAIEYPTDLGGYYAYISEIESGIYKVRVRDDENSTISRGLINHINEEDVIEHSVDTAFFDSTALSSLFDIDDSVDGLTLRQALQYMVAILIGKVTGVGTNTEIFYSPEETARVRSHLDKDGNRTAVDLDPNLDE